MLRTVDFVPTVDPEEVKRVWGAYEKYWRSDPTPNPPNSFSNIASYRGAMLVTMIQISQLMKKDLPGMCEGKPSDAMFKAIAKVPMGDLPARLSEFPPFDMEELVRLIEKERVL